MSTDRQAIHDLVALYGDAVIRRDADTFRSLWTEDAEWSLVGNAVSGRATLVDAWEVAMQGFPFVAHVAYPMLVIVEGDGGRGRWYIQEIMKQADGSAVLVFGVYTDRYQRVDGEWLFSYRRFDLMYRSPLPQQDATLAPFPEDLDKPFS